MADQEGDAWNAVALLASSCERMLNELIGCLMWEDGLRPEDCSRHFNSFIVALVAGSEFKSRLGGGWDKEGAHPIGDWYRDVALVRNEMLHGGSFPDAAAASRARAATLGLRDFIKDQLVDALDRYPRTAWLLLGSNQFDASLRALHLDRLLADPSETHWQSTAARWMRIAQHSTKFGRWQNQNVRDDDAALVAVVRPDGPTQWFVCDEPGERAFRLSGPPGWLPPAQRDAVEARAADVPISIVLELGGPLPRTGDWRPAYRLIPGVPALVIGEELDLQ